MFHKRAAHIDYSVRKEFTNRKLFYGLSITVNQDSSSSEVESQLLDIPDVVSIWPVYLVKAPTLPGLTSSGATPTSKKVANIVSNNVTDLPRVTGDLDVASALEMTGVDKVHALGIKGKGVKIGIIDTGIDYRHPSLGGGFGPGHKVEGGYAYVQDFYDGNEDPIESPDPIATCFDGGHGTHVSGIIGMEDPEGVGFGLVGVAPEATIYMYRVFSCFGISSTDILLSAMQRAASDGVDIVSMSWGENYFFQLSDPFAQMTSGLASLGIAPVVAAGNDGAAGVYYTSSPAIGVDAISVGSIANTKFPVTYKGVDSRGREFTYAAVWPIGATEPLDVYLLTADSPLGCDISGLEDVASKVNVNTTVLLLEGTPCKTGDWVYYGFKYVALLNDIDNPDPFASEYWIFPRADEDSEEFINLDASDSKIILSMYQKSGGYPNYQWTFGDKTATTVKQSITGGLMSNYSTFGPPADTLALKPQISAPGGNILATWPLGYLGGYTIISGTSMATPYFAACYALVKSQFPTLGVKEILALLQTTATPVSTLTDKSILSTAVHQGAGLVNPYQAITFESTISPGELSIGDTGDYVNVPKNITITNNSDRSKSYVISHVGAGYVEHFPYPDVLQPDSWYLYGQPQYSIYADASFSSTKILVNAGESATIQVYFSPPSGIIASKNPIISGYIKITNNNDHFSVPYAGVPYSRLEQNYFDTSNTTGEPLPFETFNLFNTAQGQVRVIDTGVAEFNLTTSEDPFVVVNTFFYTQSMRLDILPGNTTFVPDIYGFDKTAEYEYFPSSDAITSSFLGTPTYGLADNFLDQMPDKTWNAWFGQGVSIDAGPYVTLGEGDYRILISVLKWNADVSKRDSWETWLSPVIRYVP
ncbi:peptidase S8/S53 domain-containing protein [Xylogone sp. PMI_703]|nr:peptidase S8/S53 domain-containing protein [Xylogone sp. PMI_703]